MRVVRCSIELLDAVKNGLELVEVQVGVRQVKVKRTPARPDRGDTSQPVLKIIRGSTVEQVRVVREVDVDEVVVVPPQVAVAI